MLWIDYIRSVGRSDKQALANLPIQVVEAVHEVACRLESQAKAPPVDEIIQWLEQMATVFSQPLPETNGLLLYAGALDGYSHLALRTGIKRVIKTHKWPRIPYPAELLEHVEPVDGVVKLYAGWVRETVKLLDLIDIPPA